MRKRTYRRTDGQTDRQTHIGHGWNRKRELIGLIFLLIGMADGQKKLHPYRDIDTNIRQRYVLSEKESFSME